MRIGYGKTGRSMPLTLEKCGSLGGDVEMVAVVKTLAKRNPEHTFVLIGHNSGECPQDVGLPANVENPWTEWKDTLLTMKRRVGLSSANNMTIKQHLMLQTIYDKVTLPTIIDLDNIILWLGQHGTTNTPIPGIRTPDKLTKPYDWCAHYCAFLLRGVNFWRDVDPYTREEIWLNSDPRNYHKMRDLKWPLRYRVLAQRNYVHNIKHERYNDASGFNLWYCPDCTPSIIGSGVGPWGVDVAQDGMHTSTQWKSQVNVAYSRLEINGLVPGSPFGDLVSFNGTWDDRAHFGLFANEARKNVALDKMRRTDISKWVLPLEPAWMHGTWSKESQQLLGREITSAPWSDYYTLLHSTRCTFAVPNYGNGWATAKAWEAFAAGTVCFMPPTYDDQNNILADAPVELRTWLRVSSPEELRCRVDHLNSVAGQNDWLWLIHAQRHHFEQAICELTYAKMIEDRLLRNSA